jgi:hypothetical protein
MQAKSLDRLAAAVQKYAGSPSGTGLGPDINPTITIAEDVLSVLDKNAPERQRLLEPVAVVLCSRYEQFNEWNDLEQAIGYLQELIEETDEDDDAKVASLSYNYARCLRNRFMRGRSPEEIENAISFAELSVDRSRRSEGISKETLAERLDELSFTYFTKAHQLEDTSETLEKAITSVKEARNLLEGTTLPTALNYKILDHLGIYLQVKFDRSPQDSFPILEEAIDLGRSVIKQVFDDPGNQATVLNNLGLRLLVAARYCLHNPDVFSDSAGQTYLEEATDLLYRSNAIADASPVNQMIDTLAFVLDVEKLPKEHQGYALRRIDQLLRKTLDLLPQTTLGTLRNDQRDILSTLYGLSRYAAAAALENGAEPFEALQLLEYGRGIAISMHLDSHDDIAYLANQYPELEREYSAIRKELRSDEFGLKRLEERLELTRRLKNVRALIQEKPGLEEFDKVMGKDEMMKLAVEGPIVAINITNFRSDALVVSTDGVRAIPIVGIDEDKLSERSWEHQSRLAVENNRNEVFADLHKKLLRDLGLLWRVLMEPLMLELGFTETSLDPPRVWWIPTGILSLFPLHAAGNPKTGRNVMQYVVSSYTTSLKALARARLIDARRKQDKDGTVQDQIPDTALVISMDETPSRDNLPCSKVEELAVQSAFPDTEILSRPCRIDVLTTLKKSPSVVHFTCHGETIYENPFESRLLLSDWESNPLTVDVLLEQEIRGLQFAYLSVCFAADAGVENEQDECVHLASAFQVAGFPSVIGSLWYVSEEAALQVAQDFYGYFQRRGGFDVRHAARALHQATLRLWESTKKDFNKGKGDPVKWAPFIHFGI